MLVGFGGLSISVRSYILIECRLSLKISLPNKDMFHHSINFFRVFFLFKISSKNRSLNCGIKPTIIIDKMIYILQKKYQTKYFSCVCVSSI